jgi:octaprenyl-diphosphate synthase
MTKRRVIYNVKNNNGDNKRVQQVIEFVKQSGGIAYTTQMMNKYHAEALEILNTFPASPSRTSLEQLIAYTIEREK